MGGYGSGRWRYHVPKVTVECCLSVDAAVLKEEIVSIYRGTYSGAELPWSVSGRMQGTLRIVLRQGWRGGVMMYLYFTGDSQRAAETIFLQTTTPHYGGFRFWLICPLPECKRQVRKVYLPPGGYYFACRRCHHLTYRSCQEAGTRAYRLMDRISHLKRKLGAWGYDTAPAASIPPKPKGMRWKTYHRWVSKLLGAAEELHGVVLNRFKRRADLCRQQ